MCFYHDYDWSAQVVEEDDSVSNGTVRCDECFQKIAVGERYRHTYMQEYEECRRCVDDSYAFDEDDFDPDNEECKAGRHCVGETYDYDVCERCQKLLKVIKSVEEDDGCKGAETQPSLGELREVFWESDHAVDYIDRALKDYPELAFSGHLDRFYALTKEWGDFFEDRFDESDVGLVVELGGEG
jgi:hypothetical protein